MPTTPAQRAHEHPQGKAPTGGGQPGSAESEYTFPTLSVRHSALRRATVEHPLVVQFITGVLESRKRKGQKYIAFRVRGEGRRSYTYEPENQTVQKLLEMVASDPAAREQWFRLRALGREEGATLRILPLDPTAGIPRERWEQMARVIRRSFTTIIGHEPPAGAVRAAVAALAEAEAARPAAHQRLRAVA